MPFITISACALCVLSLALFIRSIYFRRNITTAERALDNAVAAGIVLFVAVLIVLIVTAHYAITTLT